MSAVAVVFAPLLALVSLRLRTMKARAAELLVAVSVVEVAVAAWLAARGMTGPELGGFFLVDATARLFLAVVALVFLGVSTYLFSRVRAEPRLRPQLGSYATFALLFLVVCTLAVLAHHVVALWGLLEASTFAAVPLITHGGRAAARRAAWRYFLFSCVGLSLALLGFVCIARSMEASGVEHWTFFFDDLATAAKQPPDVWRRVGLALALLGLGTKLGLAPMYSWLPETYAEAPPASTALLAAVQFNVALVGLLRVLAIFRSTSEGLVSSELLALGLATMAVSAFNVIAARNYKKLIAYAAMNHGGVIAVGLGVGREAAYGVVLYAVSNAFIKAILFLTAGKIRSRYRTEEIAEVSGLVKDLPYSGLLFMVGTFALLGFPPFGSFLGELVVMSALVGGGYLVVFAAFCVVLTVSFVATGRAIFPMIWGTPKRDADWGGQSLPSMLPKLLLLAGLVAMGLYLPAPVNDLFRRVAEGLGGP